MKKLRQFEQVAIAVLCLLMIPFKVYAADAPSLLSAPALPPVLITELQTGLAGSGNASKEFIELYNASDQDIDVSDWQLQYISGTASQTKHTITFARVGQTADMATILPAHHYYLLAGSSDATYLAYLKQPPDQLYTATLTDNGSLRLLAPDTKQQCTWDVIDQIGWGSSANVFEGSPAPSPLAGQSLQRYVDSDGIYLDTNNNANDFWATTSSTPAVMNTQNPNMPSNAIKSQEPTTLPAVATLAVDDCTPTTPPDDGSTSPLVPPTDSPPATIVDTPTVPSSDTSPSSTSTAPTSFPAADVGLTSPQITEILPNPAPPQTDTTDEFIELYNANKTPFDMSGFELEVGITTKHHYTFPAGTTLPSNTFVAFFSSDTKLSLSNTAGQVWLRDPLGNVIDQSDPYGTAKDGQTWALADKTWRWTTTPTPNAANVITVPAAAATKKTTSTGKKSTGTTAKTTTSKKAKTTAGTTIGSNSGDNGDDTPGQLHPAVLAIIGGFAVLYGAYEYRQDVANKLYQLRANRTARREARTGVQGQ